MNIRQYEECYEEYSAIVIFDEATLFLLSETFKIHLPLQDSIFRTWWCFLHLTARITSPHQFWKQKWNPRLILHRFDSSMSRNSRYLYFWRKRKLNTRKMRQNLNKNHKQGGNFLLRGKFFEMDSPLLCEKPILRWVFYQNDCIKYLPVLLNSSTNISIGTANHIQMSVLQKTLFCFFH